MTLRIAIVATALMTATAFSAETKRTRAEVEDMIKKVGSTKPDWWDDVTLNIPDTLDLTWPEKPQGGWNNRKNVGQFIWDIVHPNPGRWKEGIKLMQHLMAVNKSNANVNRRANNTMGHLYGECLEDFARAAHHLRLSGMNPVGLANCYWRLGCKDMAIAELNKVSFVSPGVVKLWADLGDLPRALRAATVLAGGAPDLASLVTGDAYRLHGKYTEAAAAYQRVLTATAPANAAGRLKRNQDRARASLDAIKLFEGADPTKVADGTYRSESLGYEGPVVVEVSVAAGKITAVKVVQHKEKQFYSSIADTPVRIIDKQGVKGVDATTGATITSEAIINAAAKALGKGRK